MSKFNVVYALSYEIEAEDEDEAREEAEKYFENDCQDRTLFGVNIEVKEK